jgi:uncharacterized surface protein with fasciclin (FAS1) repeats
MLPLFLLGSLLSAQTTVVDVVVNSDDHTLLEAAVIEADLAGALSGDGPFTVFAPTDDAITALVTELGITADDLLALENLADILTYHVVGATALSTDLMDGDTFTTLNGADITVSIMDGTVMINNATVTVADITADNGVVHVIDAVLMPPAPETTTVVDIIVNSEDHTLLEAAVGAAGLVDALSGEGPFTVFAPTDDAITALVTELGITADDLLALEGLADILTYHVVGATALSTDLMDGDTFTTLNGADITVSIMDGTVMINNATVTVADITTDNGVVHVIDAVLMPPAPETTTVVDIIVNSEDHTLLEAAVGAAGLVDALSGEGPFTVFAPTDDAITALVTELGITADDLLALEGLADILTYHVVGATALSTDLMDGDTFTTLNGADITISIMDGTVMVNNATVTVADITTDNGVVHVIDAVLLPPTPEVTPTVADIIAESTDHTVLAAVLDSADLDVVLAGEGPFTVFAPTDAAFDAVPPMVLLDLLTDNAALTNVLTYHVAGDSLMSTDLSDGQNIETLFGADVTITIVDGNVMVNNAMVTVADIVGANGVVHVIDAVLLPPPPTPATVVDIIVNSPAHNVLEAAVVAAGLVDALSGEGPFTVFAPTDDAFAALPEGLIDDLLADPTGTLTDILTYHVVAGTAALSTDLSDGQTIATLQGEEVTISIDGMMVMVNDANVVIADLQADNGVVHVIDVVLSLPSGVEQVDLADLFEVYPNPTTDALRWGNVQVDRLQVRDAAGRIVIETTNPAGMLDLSSLDNGRYMILIEADGQRAVKSVIKQ